MKLTTEQGTRAQAIVATVQTPWGSAPLDGQLPMGTAATVVAPLTLALSAEGDIVLASSEVATGGQLTLSARSTSVVLVRLALHYSHSASSSVNQVITQSSAFGQLQASVQFALDQGYAPSSQPAVRAAVVQVVDTLGIEYRNAAAGAARNRAALLPNLPKVTQLGQVLIDDGLFLGKLAFDGQNTTRLWWDVKEGDAGESSQLEPDKFHSALRKWGRPHLFNVQQTPITRRKAAADVVRFALNGALAGLGDLVEGCVGQLAFAAAGAVLDSPAAVQAVLTGSGDQETVDAYFKDIKPDVVDRIDAAAVALGCLTDGAKTLPGSAVKAVLRFYTGFNVASNAYGGITTYVQFRHYRQYNKSFIICEDERFDLLLCADRFEVSQKKFLVPLAKVQPDYIAKNGTNFAGRAAGLKFTLASSATAASIDENTGAVTALFPGDIVVNVLEPETGVNSNVPVATVVIPNLVPNKFTVALGETVSLYFVNPLTTDPLVLDGFDRGLAVSFEQQGLGGVVKLPQPVGDAAASFVANRTGEVDIHASFSVAGATAPLRIKVVSDGGFWDGTFTYNECSAPGYAGSGDACNYAAFPAGGNASSNTGRLLARLGSNEAGNLRWNYSVGGSSQLELCSASGSGVDIATTDTFTRPIDLAATFYNTGSSIPANMDFVVKMRTATKISGTFSVAFTYPAFGATGSSPYVPTAGVAKGVWSISPRGTSFPKCTYPAPADYCLAGNYAWFQGGGGDGSSRIVGTCDWQRPDFEGRDGEWQIR